MANFSSNQTVEGLRAVAVTVPSAGRYSVQGKITAPQDQDGGPKSAVVAAISVTAQGTIYTGQAGAEGFASAPFCNAGDVITVTLSSAATVDQGLNVIKWTLSISEGV